MPLVVFRADGGPSIGAGHVMRCLALAEYFAEQGWRTGFAASKESFASIAALAQARHEMLEIDENENGPETLAKKWLDADVLVVDHYGLDAKFEQACRPWVKRIVAIDDLANRSHAPDVLADSNNRTENYGLLVPPGCQVLAGPRFAIVNSGIRAARAAIGSRRNEGPVSRVFVSFGQIDTPNATAVTLTALQAAGFDGHTDVVLGRAAPNIMNVRTMIGGRKQLHVDVADMASLMVAADLAIGAGGVTSWERCCVGLPSILLEIADNQRGVIAVLTAADAAVNAGAIGDKTLERLTEILRELIADAQRRSALSHAAAKLVDGRALERIYSAAIGGLVAKNGELVALRPAEREDQDWLFALQQKPETRRYFRNPNPPSPEEHEIWLEEVMSGKESKLFIIECGKDRAGSVRLDRRKPLGHIPRHEISIVVDPAWHGRRVGSATLALVRRHFPTAALDAEVISQNTASLNLFLAAGFASIEGQLYRSLP